MIMAVVDVGCTQTFESRLSGQDIVEFHYRMSGSILLEGSWGDLCVREPSCLLWYQPRGCDDAAERLGVRSEVRETWVSLYCDRTWLHRVSGLDAAELLDGPTPDDVDARAPRFRTTLRIAEMVPLLKDIVRSPQSGNADWLMTIARAHELLHVTLRGAQLLNRRDVPAEIFSERDRQRIAHAREILLEEFAAPPALPDLARRTAINTSRLCCGFKSLFGETTSEFIRRQRLEHAHALLTDSDLQVREIARRSGYAHHGTFTAAFTRHFGIAPKAVRRSGRVVARAT
jgi:AraC-like DNA-binding protein